MKLEPNEEMVKALLALRNVPEFMTLVQQLEVYRNQLLGMTMNVEGEMVHRCRHRAGAVQDIIDAVVHVEQLRQRFDGETQTGTGGS